MGKTKLTKLKVPILNTEYSVSVFIGDRNSLIKACTEYTKYSFKDITDDFKNRKGLTFNMLPEKDPLIAIDGDLTWHTSIATLSHEACHAVSFIEDFLGIDDRNYEFKAYGIEAIVIAVCKLIKPWYRK